MSPAFQALQAGAALPTGFARRLGILNYRLNEVSRTIGRRVAPHFKALGEGFTNLGTRVSALQTPLRNIGKQFSQIGRITAYMGRSIYWVGRNLMWMSTIALGAIGAVLNIYREFEYELAGVTAALNIQTKDSAAAAQATEQLKDAITTAAKQYGYATQEVAQMARLMVTAGFSAEQSQVLIGLSAQFARANMLNLADTAEVLTLFFNNFGATVNTIGGFLDKLTVAGVYSQATLQQLSRGMGFFSGAAEMYGMRIEEALALLIQLTNQGVSATTAGRRLTSVFEVLASKSHQLGFAIYDVYGNFLPMTTILKNLKTKLQGFSSEAARSAYMTNLFGQMQTEIIGKLLDLEDATDADIDKLNELVGVLEEAEGATETAADIMAGTLTVQLDRLKAALTDLANIFGSVVVPILVEYIEKLREFLEQEEVKQFIEEFGRSFIEAMVETFKAAIPLVRRMLDFLVKLVRGLGAFFPGLADGASSAEILGKILGKLLSVMLMLGPAMMGIGQILQMVSLPFMGLGQIFGVLSRFAPILGGAIKGLGGIFSNMFSIVSGGGGIMSALSSGITGIFTAIGPLIPIIAFLVTAIIGLIQWFHKLDFMQESVALTMEAWAPTIDTIMGGLGILLNLFNDIALHLGTFLIPLFEWFNFQLQLLSPVINFFATIVNALGTGFRILLRALWPVRFVMIQIGRVVHFLSIVFKPLIDIINAFFGAVNHNLGIINENLDSMEDPALALANAIGQPPSTGLVLSFEGLAGAVDEYVKASRTMARVGLPAMQAAQGMAEQGVGAPLGVGAGVAGGRGLTINNVEVSVFVEEMVDSATVGEEIFAGLIRTLREEGIFEE